MYIFNTKQRKSNTERITDNQLSRKRKAHAFYFAIYQNVLTYQIWLVLLFSWSNKELNIMYLMRILHNIDTISVLQNSHWPIHIKIGFAYSELHPATAGIYLQ